MNTAKLLLQRALRLATLFVFVLTVAWLATGCDSTPADDNQEPVESLMVADLAADPFVGFDSIGRPIGTGQFAFYNLRDNVVVAAADSATTAWDVAFRGTTILVNGGDSGPGNGAGQVLSDAFESVGEAPAEGYEVDSEMGYAIPAGSGNGWYTYNPGLNLVSPMPGRVLVVRTADGRYAKLRILNYYRGAPESPDPSTDEARFYTFEFVFQPDGSRSFE